MRKTRPRRNQKVKRSALGNRDLLEPWQDTQNLAHIKRGVHDSAPYLAYQKHIVLEETTAGGIAIHPGSTWTMAKKTTRPPSPKFVLTSDVDEGPYLSGAVPLIDPFQCPPCFVRSSSLSFLLRRGAPSSPRKGNQD